MILYRSYIYLVYCSEKIKLHWIECNRAEIYIDYIR